MDFPFERGNNGKNKEDKVHYGNRGESFSIVNAFNLLKTLSNKTSFMFINFFIWSKLGYLNPFASNKFSSLWKRDKIIYIMDQSGFNHVKNTGVLICDLFVSNVLWCSIWGTYPVNSYMWGTFAYKNLPFGLKNARVTFQRVMSYAFHDIRTMIQPYLVDLPAHSN